MWDLITPQEIAEKTGVDLRNHEGIETLKIPEFKVFSNIFVYQCKLQLTQNLKAFFAIIQNFARS